MAPLRVTRETTGTRSVVPGTQRNAGERSETVYRVPPAETGDRDTSTMVTSDAPPHASARFGVLLGQPWHRRSALRLDRRRRGGDAPDQPLPTHVYVRETASRSSPGVDAPGSQLFHGQPTRFGGPHTGVRPSL